jgi:hypothetical protein
MSADQQSSIDAMFVNIAPDSELLEPATSTVVESDPGGYRRIVEEMTREITQRTGRVCFANRYPGWIGVDCPDVRAAIWLMRAMTVENVLARREDTVLFLPAHPRFATQGRMTRLVQTFERVHHLHSVKKGA